MKIIDELQKRGIFKDITNLNKMKKLKGNEGVYIGFDPTALSLHLGNYVQIMILKWFKKAGFNPIAVLGGATGMIGDPSGKSEERNLLTQKVLNVNKLSIKNQLEHFGFEVIDNFDFYKNTNVLEFLRNTGKLININYMLNKEVVSSRLDQGISFTEFTYQLIQGWDFKELYEKNNVRIQIGGSDQWGNITTGIEIIRKTQGEDNLAVGITTNLLTTFSGKKFGKSEGNAIWLDKKLSAPFEMYQYLLNIADQDVEKLLNWLTFLPISKIKSKVQEHSNNPKLRIAQKLLAQEVIQDIFSKKDLEIAQTVTDILFGKILVKDLAQKQMLLLAGSVPTFENISGNILDVMVNLSIAKSKREAREFIVMKAIEINGQKVLSDDFIVNKSLNEEAKIIKRGKKFFYLIKYNG